MKKKNEVHQLFQSFRHHQIMQNEAIAVKSFEKNPPFWLLQCDKVKVCRPHWGAD